MATRKGELTGEGGGEGRGARAGEEDGLHPPGQPQGPRPSRYGSIQGDETPPPAVRVEPQTPPLPPQKKVFPTFRARAVMLTIMFCFQVSVH